MRNKKPNQALIEFAAKANRLGMTYGELQVQEYWQKEREKAERSKERRKKKK